MEKVARRISQLMLTTIAPSTVAGGHIAPARLFTNHLALFNTVVGAEWI